MNTVFVVETKYGETLAGIFETLEKAEAWIDGSIQFSIAEYELNKCEFNYVRIPGCTNKQVAELNTIKSHRFQKTTPEQYKAAIGQLRKNNPDLTLKEFAALVNRSEQRCVEMGWEQADLTARRIHAMAG